MTKITEQLRAAGVAQVIVVLEEASSGAAAASSKDPFKAVEKHFTTDGYDQHTAIVEDGFVAALSPSAALSGRSVARKAKTPRVPKSAPAVQFFKNLGVAYGVVDRDGLSALRDDRNVKSVTGAPQLSLVRPVSKKPISKPPSKVAWGIRALNVPRLWSDGLSGAGILIAHLDTGIDGAHPVFQPDAISAFVEVDRLGRRANPHAPYDSADHGTHTAGTLVGRADRNGRAVGVAPGAQLAGGIVIEKGDSVARVLSGLDWALGQGAKVASLSLGFRGYVSDFLPIIRILRNRGILPVIAAGNEGPETSRSPGNYVEALSVGWATKDETVDPDSSSQLFKDRDGPTVPDLVAPGGDIPSARPGGGYQLMSGTSMATPHIAGLAALLWEAESQASVAEIESAILVSCAPLPNVATVRQGRGMPDAAEALRILQTG
jgi:subtilisin